MNHSKRTVQDGMGNDPVAGSKSKLSYTSLATQLLAGACCFLEIGCASTGQGPAQKEPENQAELQDGHTEFVAPYDADMGEIVLAVPKVVVSAPTAPGLDGLGQMVRSQLAATLSKCRNFVVADRESLNEISAEHRLAESGALDPDDKPIPGKLAGARYLVKVDVTEMQEMRAGNSKGTRVESGGIFKLIGSFVPKGAGTAMDVLGAINPTIGKGKESVQGRTALEIRIIDVDTGSVVGATRAYGSITRQNSRMVFGIAGISTSDSKFSESAVAESTLMAIEDAVLQIHGILRQKAQTAPIVGLSRPGRTEANVGSYSERR